MIIPAIKKRRSIRAYKSGSVPPDLLTEIIKAAQFAPTSRHNRAVEFIIITDQETKNEISATAQPEQEFVKQAPVLIVPVTDPDKTNQPVQDLTVASENIFLQAAELGLGTVWKNLKTPMAESIKSILGIPSKYMIINVIPLGYPDEAVRPHDDGEFEASKIHHEKW